LRGNSTVSPCRRKPRLYRIAAGGEGRPQRVVLVVLLIVLAFVVVGIADWRFVVIVVVARARGPQPGAPCRRDERRGADGAVRSERVHRGDPPSAQAAGMRSFWPG
jgi:hypothetical protein